MELAGLRGRRFFPVGISQVRRDGGERRLYVIVGDKGRRRRSRLPRHGDRLQFLEALEDAAHLTTPNDLLALPSGEVYVSNSGNVGAPLHDAVGTLFHRPRGSVVHYDGRGAWQQVIPRALFPNGLALHPDGRHLFVNMFGRREIWIYDRTRSQLLPQRIGLRAFPDNSTWEAPGILDVAAHAARSAYRPAHPQRLLRRPLGRVRGRRQRAAAGAGGGALRSRPPRLPRRGAPPRRIYVSQLMERSSG